MNMNLALGMRLGLLNALVLFFFLNESSAQAPDWMFALEGSYVGRMEEVSDVPDEVSTRDARLDGKRNGKEDGFVLQWALATDVQISEVAEMWTWQSGQDNLLVTRLEGNRPVSKTYWVSESGNMTVLTCGSSEGNQAVLERIRIQRIPGQLRFDRYVNFGDGNWEFRSRFVLDEFIPD